MKRALLFPVIVLTTGTFLRAQGPLTPPPGADPALGPASALNGSGQPQATMKSLHQVEPRTPLAAGSAGVTVRPSGGYTITGAGSYYLTAALTVDSDDGVVIAVPGVTLDLNGFRITGTGGGTNFAGVHVTVPDNAQGAITVKNGYVTGNGYYHPVTGVVSGTGFANGIKVDHSVPIQVSGIHADSYRDTGFDLGESSRVDNCSASYCETGISAGIVTHCQVQWARTGISVARAASHCAVNSGGTAVTGISSSSKVTISRCSVSINAKTGPNYAFSGGAMVCDGCVADLTVTAGDARCYLSGKGVFTNCTGYVNHPGTAVSDLCMVFSNPNGVVKGCVAEAINPANRNTAIWANVADGCVINAGTTTIANRYNMPATP